MACKIPFHKMALCVLLLLGFSAAPLTAQPQAPQPGGAVASSHPLLHYTLPPDKLKQAYALYRIDVSLYLIVTQYGFIVLYLMLRTRFGAALRDLAERATRVWLIQAALVIAAFFVSLELLELPFRLYRHRLSLQYGLSVQQWPSWFGDWAKALGIDMIIAILLGWMVYGLLRHSPRRAWFYSWLATIPFLLFGIFIQPILIDPLFDKFEPLAATHPELVDQIERVVQRAGMEIPRSRMFQMKASEKTTELNAYVTGFGASQRVVVWDTTMRHLTTPETLYVFGHEMGHYVLGHIVKGFILTEGLLFLLFYLAFRICNFLIERHGRRWSIHTLGDLASAPLLMLVFSLLAFLATPLSNAVSRHFEHQADQYGLEVIHGLVPGERTAAAHSFQILGERSLDYPYVGRFAEFWLWTHPTIADREIFVQTYDPWSQGKSPEFVK